MLSHSSSHSPLKIDEVNKAFGYQKSDGSDQSGYMHSWKDQNGVHHHSYAYTQQVSSYTNAVSQDEYNNASGRRQKYCDAVK